MHSNILFMFINGLGTTAGYKIIVQFILLMAADKCEEEEDLGSASSDSFINDSENDEPSTSGQDDGVHLEARYTKFLHE